MRGGIEETSASFEARSAPRSYPTGGESQQWLSYPTNPHVRFDERGRETGRCRMAQATAPVLDSTTRRCVGALICGRGRAVFGRGMRACGAEGAWRADIWGGERRLHGPRVMPLSSPVAGRV